LDHNKKSDQKWKKMILAVAGRLKFETSLGYIVRPCLKINLKKGNRRKRFPVKWNNKLQYRSDRFSRDKHRT
jgi:hypothetical protein